jgi:hypothetical protein
MGPGDDDQTLYKLSIRAEPFDSMNSIRHKWRGCKYSNSNQLDMTFHTAYLSQTSSTDYAPTIANNLKLGLSYSNKQEKGIKHDLFNKWPLTNKNREIGINVSYTF